MDRNRLAGLGFAALLLVPGAAVACDQEDQKDVQEGVNDAENQIDNADTDGKDD